MKVKVWTDGSCSPNPGPGAWAIVMQHPSGRLESFCGFLPNTTSNRAELRAILEAIRKLIPLGGGKIYSDSKWCVNVINRRWRATKNLGLIEAIGEQINHLDHFELCWLPRGQNLADTLANETMQLGRVGALDSPMWDA